MAAAGADAVVQTDNVQAGEIACQYIVDRLGGKGNVIIQNGPAGVGGDRPRQWLQGQSSPPRPTSKVLSDDQDGKGSREGGLNVMLGHLTPLPEGRCGVHDQRPAGHRLDLAARQLKRMASSSRRWTVAPDIEDAIRNKTLVEASASQDPY